MRFKAVFAAGAAVLFVLTALVPVGAAEKPTVTKPCTNCHDAAADVVRGNLSNLSNKASTLQVSVGKANWIFDFNDKTTFENVEGIKKLKKDKEIAITYVQENGKLYARGIATKPVFEVPQEMLVDTAYVENLVQKSPSEGGYVLVDARPGTKYEEGHIRHAVSMPLFAFDKMKDSVLPQDKDAVVLFYCGGVT